MSEQPLPAAEMAASSQPKGGRRSLAASHPLLSMVARRSLYGVFTLLVVSFLIFLATNVLPGNVAQIVMGKGANPQAVASLAHALGLDQPLTTRYLHWIGGVLHGNLGDSAVALAQSSATPQISRLIGGPLLNSLVLAGLATVLLIPLSLASGVLMAVCKGRPADQIASYLSLVFGCLPEFVLGSILILILSTRFGWLPPVDILSPGQNPLANFSGLVLPVLTLLGVVFAFTTRQVRASMIVALRQEYVPAARLNGLPERKVLGRYALRNALPATIQSYAQAVQYLFGGIIVVEVLFSYPGIGTLLVQSVSQRDTPTVASIALVLAAAYIAINIAADVLVTFLVPKLRTGAQR